MAESSSSFMPALERASEVAREVADGIFSATRPGAVFSEPMRAGDYTVITASEITTIGGFGYGAGGAQSGETAGGEAAETAAPDARPPAGTGGGGGGGGTSLARPVATIVIGPDGVKVQPIVDPTKIALAAMTAWGAIAVTLVRMSRLRRA